MFRENRKKLLDRIKDNSIVVLFANKNINTTNADQYYPYIPNSNFYYFTGINQSESILILLKKNNVTKELLFIEKRNPLQVIWNGHVLSDDKAKEISGISGIKELDSFNDSFHTLAGDMENIYLHLNKITTKHPHLYNHNKNFIDSCREKFPFHSICSITKEIQALRTYKSDFEIDLIKKAASITSESYRELTQHIKPSISENALEVELQYQLRTRGASGFAYEPIFGGGINSCILHYTDNNKVLKEGEILLIDAAAEYKNYKSDVTRTYPISGKFTSRQKDVYNAVLRVLEQATKYIKAGKTMKEVQCFACNIMQEELAALKLIEKDEMVEVTAENVCDHALAFKKYYMHNIGHHIGLDTHDDCDPKLPLQNGAVVTIEPGIYIPKERIGIRLEDMIHIKQDTTHNLTSDIPIAIDDIEWGK